MMIFLTSTALVLIYLDIPLHTVTIALAVSSMLILNAITWWRLRHQKPISEHELLLQLLGDIMTLTALFYFTGGYSNPFVWMYLLPLAVGAVALKQLYAWLLAFIAIVCYSVLVFFYVPLSHLHMHYQEGYTLDIHLVGMWMGFVFSAGIIAIFISRIGQNLRDYDHLMAEAREHSLESERMLALGTLATGAAHELGTPLATMAVLTKELTIEYANDPNLLNHLKLLRSQVDRCKTILSSIAAAAGKARGEDSSAIDIETFLKQTMLDWHNTRPSLQLISKLEGPQPAPAIVTDRTLTQALVNLLDNSADASPEKIAVVAIWDAQTLDFKITDFGAGLSNEVAAQMGTPFFSTKPAQGMGLGLYLSKMIIGRFGGSITLNNLPEGGVLTHIQLPLHLLTIIHRHDSHRF